MKTRTGGIQLKRGIPHILIFALAAMLLFSCGKEGPQNIIKGKGMSYPEVKLESAASSAKIVLPEIPELRWDFFPEPGHAELTCKFKMQVTFKEEGKFNAKIQFLDLNNFPVTTEKIKMIGKKDEQVAYERTLYIDQKVSRRITKAQILLTPIP
jgi:hypothetical protein